MIEKNGHLGSSFDDFLKEQSFFKEAVDIASRRAYAFQLKEEMDRENIGVSIREVWGDLPEGHSSKEPQAHHQAEE